MSDYTPVNDFSAKDALTTGDPEKVILGSDMDSETAAIQTAVNTKYDSDDLASQAQAEAEASNVVLMTPLRVANWADFNAGMVGDIQALTSPGADRLLGWDQSATAAIGFTVSGALAFNSTDLTVTAAAILTQLLTVDGAGSGLDADLLDGQSSAFYQSASNLNAGTLPDARFPATLPAISGANLTNLDASDLASGTVPDARVASTNFNANNLTSGTVPEARLSAVVIASPTNSDARELGYRGAPKNQQSDNYTLVLADAAKVIEETGTSKTITIPANASVAFPIGTMVGFFANGAAVSIAITTDNLYLAGTAFSSTGTRQLANGGVAFAYKFGSQHWMIWGQGLS